MLCWQDFDSKCRYAPRGTFDPPHFNHHELHDVLQRSGGELSNRLLHSHAAHRYARRNCDLEPDGKHGVRDGLQFEPARVSGRMRADFPFAIGKFADCLAAISAAGEAALADEIMLLAVSESPTSLFVYLQDVQRLPEAGPEQGDRAQEVFVFLGSRRFISFPLCERIKHLKLA
jgi:hypothetical protein